MGERQIRIGGDEPGIGEGVAREYEPRRDRAEQIGSILGKAFGYATNLAILAGLLIVAVALTHEAWRFCEWVWGWS